MSFWCIPCPAYYGTSYAAVRDLDTVALSIIVVMELEFSYREIQRTSMKNHICCQSISSGKNRLNSNWVLDINYIMLETNSFIQHLSI